jgi:hypothetical protein
MNRKVLWVFLVILFIIGVVVLNSFVKQRQLTVTYSTAGPVDSRQKEIMIKVSDSDDVSIPNATIRYEQINQEFMYNIGEYSENGAKEAGSNTEGIYLDWFWGKLEPQDDVYNWSFLEQTGVVDGQGKLKSDAEHVFLRLGVIATSAWIVGEKMDSFQETGYPGWIDKNNLTQVKTKYLEFVTALLNHLQFKPDFYMIEVEGNVLGINAGLTNQEIIDWYDMLTNTIKETDTTAKVSIAVSSSDLSPFMEEQRTKNKILVEQDRFPLNITDFLKRMNNTNYDMITVFIQPFGWFSKGNWSDGRNFLESLCTFNREVYIASVSFLAEEPDVPDVIHPVPNGVNTTGFVYYPNLEGHSEEWQKEQTVHLMQFILSNPKIVGVHWDIIDFTETGVGGQNVDVRLATGFTSGYRNTKTNEVFEGEKRQVYDPMKELWLSVFSKGSLQTDANGIGAFAGLPGEYRVIISHPNFETKEIVIKV